MKIDLNIGKAIIAGLALGVLIAVLVGSINTFHKLSCEGYFEPHRIDKISTVTDITV